MGIENVPGAMLGNRRAAGEFATDLWGLVGNRGKIVLTTACVAAVLLFWFAGRWFGIPRHEGFEASLVVQPRPAAALLLAGLVLWVSAAVCTAIAATVRLDAGLFAACVGLAALSVRGGPSRYVYQMTADRGTFLALATELIILYAFVAIAWLGIALLHRRGRLSGDALYDGLQDQPHSAGDRVSAAGAQALAMAVLMLLLARTDDQKQVIAAVFLSSFLATLLAYAFTPVRPSAPYWAGPLLVGVAGYVAASLNWGQGSASLWKSGLAAGFLAPLARPLPLDYAALGPAGALLGYWMSRRWQRAKELELEAQSAPPAPPPARVP